MLGAEKWPYRHLSFLEKHGNRAHIFSISLSKSDRFSKTHIYSERGNFGASSYVKNSTSDFFRKIEFSTGGGHSGEPGGHIRKYSFLESNRLNKHIYI